MSNTYEHKSIDAITLSNGNLGILGNFAESGSPPTLWVLNNSGQFQFQKTVGELPGYRHKLVNTRDGEILAVGISSAGPSKNTLHVMKFDENGNTGQVTLDPYMVTSQGKRFLSGTTNHDSDSLRNMLSNYQAVLSKNPNNKDALWGAANILEYTGLYKEAAGLYRVLAELDGLSKSYKQEVVAHAITCEYLAGKKQKSKPKPIQKQVKELARVIDNTLFTEKAIAERSKWSLLKELSMTVLTVGATGLSGADQATINKALDLLDDWIYAPVGQGVEARNRYLNGMLATISSLIIRNKLGLKVSIELSGREHNKTDLPPKELAEMQTRGRGDFNSLEVSPKQQTSKKVLSSDDFSIGFSRESSSEGISGLYKCISTDYSGKAEIRKSAEEFGEKHDDR